MDFLLKGVPYNLIMKANKFEWNTALKTVFGEKERKNKGKKTRREEEKKGGRKEGKGKRDIEHSLVNIKYKHIKTKS